jgi:hypothetical protein
VQGARLLGRVPVAWWEGVRDCNSSVTPSFRLDNKAYPRTYITFTRTANRCCIQISNVKHLANTPPPSASRAKPPGYFLAVCGERGKKPGEAEGGSLHSHARNAVFPDLPQPSLPPPIFLARLCMFRGCLSGDFRYLQTQRRLASRSFFCLFRCRLSTRPGVTIFGLGFAGCHCSPTTGNIQAVPRPQWHLGWDMSFEWLDFMEEL